MKLAKIRLADGSIRLAIVEDQHVRLLDLARSAAIRSEISVIIAKRVLRRLYSHVAVSQLGTYLNEQSFRANAVQDRSLFWSAIEAFPAPPVSGGSMHD